MQAGGTIQQQQQQNVGQAAQAQPGAEEQMQDDNSGIEDSEDFGDMAAFGGDGMESEEDSQQPGISDDGLGQESGEQDGELSDLDATGEEDGDDSNINNDSTANLLNKLSKKQLKAVRNYAESLMGNESEEDGEDTVPNNGELSESIIFTKKQLRELNERLGDIHSDDEKRNFVKKEKNAKKKSPFKTPNFK